MVVVLEIVIMIMIFTKCQLTAISQDWAIKHILSSYEQNICQRKTAFNYYWYSIMCSYFLLHLVIHYIYFLSVHKSQHYSATERTQMVLYGYCS